MPNNRIEDGQKEIAIWIEKWDERIANWIKVGQIDKELAPVFAAYEGKKQAKLDLTAMPEPYVGDPTGAVDAVMLMLNPGESGPKQKREDGKECREGELVKEVRESTYHDVAKNYLLDETKGWWVNKRSLWPARLLGTNGGTCTIVGIDLIPWHSKIWGSVELNPTVLSWIKENVLRPATIVSRKSKLTTSSKIGIPIVLAIGAQHKSYLKEPYYKLLREVSDNNHGTDSPPWPVKRNGEPVHRNIRLYVAEDKSLAILQTDTRGSFKTPNKEFDPIVREMLCLSSPKNEFIDPIAVV